METQRDLRRFTGHGYDKGRGRLLQALWILTDTLIARHILCPPRARVALLRMFGANIGQRVLIRHGVRIHWPWKLTLGNDVWIGVDAWLLNLEPIVVGSNVCISQGAFLCTGSHDADSPTFEFDNSPIVVKSGSWIAAKAVVLRGVTIGENAVIGATSLVSRDVPANSRVFAARSSLRSQGVENA